MVTLWPRLPARCADSACQRARVDFSDARMSTHELPFLFQPRDLICAPLMLNVGDKAPDFEATDCQGRKVSLATLRGRPVVLFFFPKAFTIGCTIEIRAFRDNYGRIRELGAELVGVSV